MALIPKSAIRKFLDAPRRDCRAYKKMSERQLEICKISLPITPPIWNKLRIDQKQCFILGAHLKRLYIGADTGTGKTLISIALVRYFRRLGQVKCALVLVPNKVNKYEWAREIAKHSPSTTYVILAGSSEQKWQQLTEGRHTLAITTYAGLMHMLCRREASRKKPGRERLVPDLAKMKRLLSVVDGLVLDEVTEAKNRGKLPFRLCRKISQSSSIVLALAGVPFNDPVDLWGQMYLVDAGETLGKTLGLFRAAFCSEKPNGWGGIDYTFKKSMDGVLHRILANRFIRIDAIGLPPVVEVRKDVKLPGETLVHAQRAEQALMEAHGNYQATQNAFLRMRQISSGFLGYYDDEEGIRAELEFEDKPKLDMLLGILQSIGGVHKSIVFYEFNYSADMISRALDRLKIGHVRIYGKTRNHEELLRKFDNDAHCPIMLLQNRAGFGLNLQVARYSIYYESPVSPIIRTQTERRSERQYSPHKTVFRYDLVTLGTYDARILASLAAGEDLFQSIIRGKRKAA